MPRFRVFEEYSSGSLLRIRYAKYPPMRDDRSIFGINQREVRKG